MLAGQTKIIKNVKRFSKNFCSFSVFESMRQKFEKKHEKNKALT